MSVCGTARERGTAAFWVLCWYGVGNSHFSGRTASVGIVVVSPDIDIDSKNASAIAKDFLDKFQAIAYLFLETNNKQNNKQQ